MHSSRKAFSDLLILCANLKRRPDRRFSIKYGLNSVLGQPIQFINSIDPEDQDFYFPSDLPGRTTKSSFAVRQTKILALESFLRTQKNFLLYLEDDVAVTEDFDDTLVRAINKNAEIFFLGGEHEASPRKLGDWLGVRSIRNNHALLFNRDGARKTIEILQRNTEEWSDREISVAIERGEVSALCPLEMVAFQRETESDNSGFTGSCRFPNETFIDVSGDGIAVIDAILNSAKIVYSVGFSDLTIFIGEKIKGFGQVFCSCQPTEIDSEEYREVAERAVPIIFDQDSDHRIYAGERADLVVIEKITSNLDIYLDHVAFAPSAYLGVLFKNKNDKFTNIPLKNDRWTHIFTVDAVPREQQRGIRLYQLISPIRSNSSDT